MGILHTVLSSELTPQIREQLRRFMQVDPPMNILNISFSIYFVCASRNIGGSAPQCSQEKNVLKVMIHSIERNMRAVPTDYLATQVESLVLYLAQSRSYSDDVMNEFAQFKGYLIIEEVPAH